MSNRPILFLPIVEWEFRTQRPQQLARCFARAGARVYYPDLRLHPEPGPPRLAESGVWRFALRGNPALDPYRDRLPASDLGDALESLRSLAGEHPLDDCWIVAQLPFWRPLAEAARSAFGGALLFDCMDDFRAFADHGDLGEEEDALAAAADLVTVTARRLYERFAPRNARTLLLHNGCDPEHFGPACARLPSHRRPVVGFFGGIHEWFDGPLVAELARLRPEWDVWLIGDTYGAEVGSLRALPNVFFLGEMPYAELPRLVSHFDAGIIPFRVTPLTEATDPVKAYEMLAAGLPVVASDLPELRRLAPHVAVARNAAEFAARIEERLGEPYEARLARRELARRHSWVERFLVLRQAMDDVRPPAAEPSALAGEAPPTHASLGLAEVGWGRGDLVRRIEQLRGELAEREELVAQRGSLAEQRDRVQAEAERLGGELARVEAERLRGERELRRMAESRWWRLGERLRRLGRR